MLNNFKFDYGKKYHYLLKYIIMSIPVLLLVLSFLFPKKEITNNYSVESETTINYKYQTNEVNNVDDLIVGNAYYVNLLPIYNDADNYETLFNDMFNLDRVFYFSYFSNDEVYIDSAYLSIQSSPLDQLLYIGVDIYSADEFAIFYYSNNVETDELYFNEPSLLTSVYCCCVLNNNNKYKLSPYYSYVSILPTEYNIIDNTTITNTINDNSSVLSVDEVRINNTDYLKPLNDFYKLNINSWYDNLLSAMNLDLDNETTYFIYHIPLYIVYLYIFDIILDLFGMVFRLGHKLISKVGGDY